MLSNDVAASLSHRLRTTNANHGDSAAGAFITPRARLTPIESHRESFENRFLEMEAGRKGGNFPQKIQIEPLAELRLSSDTVRYNRAKRVISVRVNTVRYAPAPKVKSIAATLIAHRYSIPRRSPTWREPAGFRSNADPQFRQFSLNVREKFAPSVEPRESERSKRLLSAIHLPVRSRGGAGCCEQPSSVPN